MKHLIKKGHFFSGLKSTLTALLLVLISSNVQAQCPTANLVENPSEFQWTYHAVSATNPEAYYSGTMEVGEATLTLNNGETFTTRAYRQEGTDYTVPGPTIKVTPGNKYILSLHNTLPYEVLSTSHNVFKDPNAVNIHTHGLHISGESPSDDVTRVFEGGRGGDFVWDIPADHMGGTYWYHAHHHGSTLLQVAGGMLGMLIVDDSNDNIPSTVAGMEERELIFAKIDPTVAGTGGDDLMGGSLSGATWTTNGVIGGNICMPANTWQHWRVLVADANAMLRAVEFGPEFEVMILARDGVWRTVAPKDLASNSIQLTGASRADFAVRTTGNSTISVGGNVMANIYVDGTPDATVHPFDLDGVSTWSATRPSYLRDLRTETNVNNESISMGARTVDGSKYDHHTPTLTLPTTQVQEWSISGNVRHPFHLHVYHVQALADDRDFEAGEFYDVLASQMTVRFDLNQNTTTPYSGRTIMHCHILDHEDQGAMGWLNVDGGALAPTFPADADLSTPYSDYYVIPTGPTVPSAASSLTATAISTSAIDLAWADNASDEDGFNIERSLDGTNFTFIGSVGTDVVSFNDNGLTASTQYFYRVTAYNATGSASASNVADATTDTPLVAPSAPSSLSATAVSSSSIDLAWIDNSSNEDGFNIERSLDGTNFSALTTVGANVSSYSDNGLTASTIYYYRVSAYNGAGSSAASNVANATTDALPTIPNAPTSLSATAASSSSIDLVWADNASDEDGYNIERSLDGSNFSALTTVGANVTAYNDNGLTASTIYYYRVSAYNVAGSSAVSNVASTTTDAIQAPSAPSSLSATATSSSSIDLAWSDNATDEDGYNIERSLDGTNFSALTTVGANVTSYSDNGLTASTTYYYRAIAYNIGGNSAASNVANATTSAAAPEMHVENIVVTRGGLNGNRFEGIATITIQDATGATVSGATVNVSYTGPNSGTRSGTTNGSGEVTFTTSGQKNPSGEWCFEVTNVSLAGTTYNASSNVMTSACESGPLARDENSDNEMLSSLKAQTSKDGSINNSTVSSFDSNLNVYPNPFQDGTRIAFQLSENSNVVIEVYSIQGKRVALIANGNFEAGQLIFDWNTQQLESGTYFLKLKAGKQVSQTQRLTLIR